jgi:hypothetical protein
MNPRFVTEEEFSKARKMELYGIATETEAVRTYQQSGYDINAKLQIEIWEQQLRICEDKSPDE